MSNIGFMQHFAKHVEELYKECINNPKKSPTKVEKEDYMNTVYNLELMRSHNEIEDLKLYDVLMKKIISCDLTKLTEERRKLKKSRSI